MKREQKCTCKNLAPANVHFKGCPAITPPLDTGWEDDFDIALLKYLEYLNLKTATMQNRPVNEYSYPEFDKIKEPIRKAFLSHESQVRESVIKEIKGKGRKAWIIGNVISFERPNYESPVFDTEEVIVTSFISE